jgi:GT2 family glycosyltransferase
MKKKDFSLIIPAYNAEKTIEKCLESVINQTVKPTEIILVDDGSTDKTIEKAHQFKNIKVIKSKENKGVSHVLNLGLKNSKFPLIAFLDSDSYARKDFFALLLKELLKNENIGIVSGSNRTPDEYKDRYYTLFDMTNRYGFSPDNGGYMGTIYLGCTIIKRGIFDKIGPFDERLLTHEDLDFCLRARSSNYLIFYQPKAITDHFHQRLSLKSLLKHAYKYGKYGTLYRLKNKPYAPMSRYIPNNFLITILLFPVIVIVTTFRIVIKNVRFTQAVDIFSNLHLIFLYQFFFSLGMVKGTYLFNNFFDEEKTS